MLQIIQVALARGTSSKDKTAAAEAPAVSKYRYTAIFHSETFMVL
jgi:hypothetical protein